MYRWLWDHLPGPTAVKALLAAGMTAVVAVLVLVVAVPVLRPAPVTPNTDGSASDTDGVIEPDGVRQSVIAPPADSAPTPSVTEDNVPQQ
jgi:hypothetical protein